MSNAGIQASHRSSKVVRDLENLEKNLGSNPQESVPWIKTLGANVFFGLVIVANGFFIGVELEHVDGFHWGIWTVESVFLVLFALEIFLRLRAEWPQLRNYLDAWGVADILCTVLGIADTWVLTPIVLASLQEGQETENPLGSLSVFRMFRLLRLVRLVRVMRKFNELLVIVKTIRNSVRAVAWMSILLGMLIYMGSIFTVLLLGPHAASDPEVNVHFGSLGSALYSHFQAVSLEDWPSVALAAMGQSRLWAVYFIVFITFGNAALVNVMVGIIVEQVLKLSWEQEIRRASFSAAIEQLRNTIRTVFELADLDANGKLTKEELRLLLKDPWMREIMLAFGMNMHIPHDMIHTIMDLSGDGAASFPEFFDACMRLSGSTENLHSVFVQHDICSCRQELLGTLDILERELQALPGRAARAVEKEEEESLAVEAEIKALRGRLERFGQKQLQIQAEMLALKEHYRTMMPMKQPGGRAHAHHDLGPPAAPQPLVALPPPPLVLPPAAVSPLGAAVAAAQKPRLLLHKLGQELGEWAMDAVFGEPPKRPRAREPTSSSGEGQKEEERGSLRAEQRRLLEAEFAAKKAAEDRRRS
mmetsp:Transcript_121160/g.354078  ORF Transcript_121160/g.354078 Transcript_121160/m.354078 type:complete len:589 (-) Transcript_121160:54-1820(-)